MDGRIREAIRDSAVDQGYLADWLINSVAGGIPEWTEEHIDEIIRDFYIIPKPVVDGE